MEPSRELDNAKPEDSPPETLEESIARLLSEHRDGDESALPRLLPIVYSDLHRLARAIFGGRAGHTLQPTALVNEAWLKIAGRVGHLEDRNHFLAVAARAMRQILSDHARQLRTQRRGSGNRGVTLIDVADGRSGRDFDLIALDDSLSRLTTLNERHARVVELRYLAGLTIDETAEVLGVSHGTVEADWTMARAWLLRELQPA